MVKIRLQRQGKKKAPFYHIVVADSKSPRDGKIIEQIGTYDPMTKPSTIVLNKEKLEQWIKNGAQPTDTVKSLIKNAVTYTCMRLCLFNQLILAIQLFLKKLY